MAVAIPEERYGNSTLHTWNLTTADPTGDSIQWPGAADRTVQFISSAFGGATVIMEGSLDDNTFFTLTDGQGNAISFTDEGGEMIAENTLFIRPRLSVAGTAAVVAVLLLSRSTMR